MPVRPGIMTGLHVQSVDLFVHGSELYSRIGIFQSSSSARTNDLPTSNPNSCTNDCGASTTPAVGPHRPLLVLSLATASLSSVVGCIPSLLSRQSILWLREICGVGHRTMFRLLSLE